MADLNLVTILFIIFAFLFQIVLIIHFVVRRREFETAIRYGPVVYSLGLPALALSVAQSAAGQPWFMWLGGILYAVWALFGYTVEYVRRIDWRGGGHAVLFGIYVTLYLATVMFYWWPLSRLSWSLWTVYGVLFLIATVLNIASHRRPPGDRPRPA